MRRLVPVWFLGLSVLLCGCDREGRKVERARQAADSWAATLEETVDQWSRHRVPATYVRQIADAAEKSLRDASDSMGKVVADRAGGGQVKERLSRLRQRAHDVSEAAGRADVETAKDALSAPSPLSGTDAPGGRPS
jgi:hypothetical protein